MRRLGTARRGSHGAAAHQRGRRARAAPDPGAAGRVHDPKRGWQAGQHQGAARPRPLSPPSPLGPAPPLTLPPASGSRPRPPQVGLVGDLANGRTVRSLAYLLSKFRGVELFFVAPPVVRMGEDIKAHLTAEGVPWREVEDLTARRPTTLDAQNPG